MSASRRRPSRRDVRRTSRRRPRKTTLLIVCEGRETERNYLDGLKRDDDVARFFVISIKPANGGSRTQIVDCAIKKKNTSTDIDEVHCVLDTESLQTAEAHNDLMEARRIARQHRIQLHLSNPAFEVWMLAHFVRTCKHFKDADAVIADVNKEWEKVFRQKYVKNDRGIYGKLADRTLVALKNAKDVATIDHQSRDDVADRNSSTDFYLLAERLLGKKRET